MSEHKNYREFTDSTGVRWKAYRVEPQSLTALDRFGKSLSANVSERRNPWLLFESPDTRRRLSPVPEAWDENPSSKELEQWCALADPIPPAPERREDDRRH